MERKYSTKTTNRRADFIFKCKPGFCTGSYRVQPEYLFPRLTEQKGQQDQKRIEQKDRKIRTTEQQRLRYIVEYLMLSLATRMKSCLTSIPFYMCCFITKSQSSQSPPAHPFPPREQCLAPKAASLKYCSPVEQLTFCGRYHFQHTQLWESEIILYLKARC